MKNRLGRLLQHRWHDESDLRRALVPAALARLEAHVAASEQRHGGQIRLCVEAGMPLSYLWRHATARQRAVALFGKLRVWDTAHNNGVLIYLLLAERAIEIVADRGLTALVPAAAWQQVAAGLGQALRERHYEQGLDEAIAAVDVLLVQHFPRLAGQDYGNELPDRVVQL
jgi:uncharacterized membrane protein